ncbi:EamA family transporter RarD [bacterium]|nr:MAG: EamA family transporter RarD [bacterium]
MWCAVCVWLLLAFSGKVGWWRALRARTFGLLCATALLITLNWGTYIYGVATGHVLETSLGYFITPLVSVLFGVAVLGERLSALQWFAVACAAAGMVVLTVGLGVPPTIALVLAVTFGAYGLIRKQVDIDPVQGLAVESTLMLPPAVALLFLAEANGVAAFTHGALSRDVLLVAGGAVTAVPLVLFAYGARRVTLTALGFLQYVAPTVQCLLGIFVFHETFGRVQAIAFGLIWTALAVFTADGLRRWWARPGVGANA